MVEASRFIAEVNNRGNETRGSDRFYLDCLKALSGVGEEAALVLDDSGQVLFCNDAGAAIFGRLPEGLAGKHISEFVPDTRLSTLSPGSNVAYAAYTGRRNQWREFCVLDATGHSFPVELLFDVLVVDLRYLIMLWVRMPARRAGFMEASSERPPKSLATTHGDAAMLV